jgi:hypothetical protein
VRRSVAVVGLLVLSLLLATAASGRDPRLERVQLRPADVALAQRITLKQKDVGASWRPTRIPDSEGQRLTCPGFNPDFSRFTISGKANSGFTQPTGASSISTVEVYESRADAIGDFQTGAKPIVARCLKQSLERELKGTGGLVQATVPVARVVAAPRVGDRRIAYRIVARIEAENTRVDLYLDVVVVQRGRSIAAFFFTSPIRPMRGTARIVSAAAARMR